jgi:hypothetical protein
MALAATGSGERVGTRTSFKGISEIEHVASGNARVDGNAARVAGASTGSASDQGKVARVAMSELGDERISMELMGSATWPIKPQG